MASTHIVNILLNAAVPTEFRAQVGRVLIGVAVLNIVTNLAITIYSSIVDVYNDNVEKRRAKSFMARVQKKIKNRKLLVDKTQGEFKSFELQVTLYEAVMFAREWTPHRRWLISNKIKLDAFEEE